MNHVVNLLVSKREEVEGSHLICYVPTVSLLLVHTQPTRLELNLGGISWCALYSTVWMFRP